MLAAPVAHAYAADAAPPAAGAPAAPAAKAADEQTLGEVVVTARRRAENVQDVPAAVTALSGATRTRS
jgi:iron complex outermembrane receptor protein